MKPDNVIFCNKGLNMKDIMLWITSIWTILSILFFLFVKSSDSYNLRNAERNLDICKENRDLCIQEKNQLIGEIKESKNTIKTLKGTIERLTNFDIPHEVIAFSHNDPDLSTFLKTIEANKKKRQVTFQLIISHLGGMYSRANLKYIDYFEKYHECLNKDYR